MNATDIVLVLVLAGAFLVGFFQGVVRGLLALAAWVVAFLLGANLTPLVGGYLATQWTNLDTDYVHMLAFAIVSTVTFVVLMILIYAGTRGPRGFTAYPLLDDLIGGILGLILGVAILATVMVILATYYGPGAPVPTGPDVELSESLARALNESAIGKAIAETVVPVLLVLFGGVVPGAVRDAMEQMAA